LSDSFYSTIPAPEPKTPEPQEIEVLGDQGVVRIDEKTGALEIPMEDGSVIVDFNGEDDDDDDEIDEDEFGENLAEDLAEDALSKIAEELLAGIEADDRSRESWLQTRANGIDILGLKIERPGIGASTAPLEGMSTVRHPLLLEAVLRFQANARGELLPSAGPCKVRTDSEGSGTTADLAESLERGFNHYLTSVATEYYPDTDRMLFLVGFGGCGFKKVYSCPLRQRPVSDSVDAKDIIVSNAATDLKSAGRVTHQIEMRPSVLKRMQLVGAYRDVVLSQPTPEKNQVDEKIAEVQGVDARPQRPEDHSYTIFECYCEIDIPGFEHKDEDGEISGLPVPYRVVIEKDSRKILEIRRNWKQDDEMCLARAALVKYPFVPGLGFYDIGLLHILGNSANALTAAWREMLDAGMFASFPGFLYSKMGGRQMTNEFRIPPGGGQPIDTGGQPIGNMVMALPYRDITPGLIGLTQSIDQSAQRVGGTAEMNIGEGKQEVPVGTTLALIEQATKVMDAVHKRLHAAQAEEFQLLKDCFREDPEAFWRHDPRCKKDWEAQKFITALNDCDLVPAADPNTPSHTHRIMKATAIKQLQQANPDLYNARAVDSLILKMIGWNDPEGLFNPPQPPGPPQVDPTVTRQLDLLEKEIDTKLEAKELDLKDSEADRKSKEDIALLNLAKELAINVNKPPPQFPGSGPPSKSKQPPPKSASLGGRVF
jgi:hypothetical protein